MIQYMFTPEMGEISGFGGSYEDACRLMLRAALLWLDDHPDADPKFHGYKGVYGIMTEDNEDAKALSDAAVNAVGGDCTGAMHQAVMTAAIYIRKNGWDAYVKIMSER